MKTRPATISFLFVLCLLAVFIYKRWQEPRRGEAFNRHPSHIYYTKHALCRMDCRHITKEAIEEVMRKGVILYNRDYHRGACPTYPLQYRNEEGDLIRVICAQCADETKIVTCYNVEEHSDCHCPGDPVSGQAPNQY